MNKSEENTSKRNIPESEEIRPRSFRPRRTDRPPYSQGNFTEDPYTNSRSRYDEVQPTYNASRQDFEQRQARNFRRYEPSSSRGSAPYPQRSRSAGYDNQKGYAQPRGTSYPNRQYGRPEQNGYYPRAGRDTANSYQNFKKPGKHSNEPLPKKIKERPLTIIQALGKLHYGSRNICLAAIREGLVKINGLIVTKQNAPFYPLRDTVAVNNITLKPRDGSVYIAFHKPRKLSGSDERGEPSMYSILDKEESWFFPTGCLNRAASGIVIITNDAAHKVQAESPIADSLKEYHIKIHSKPKPKEVELLKSHLLNLSASGMIVHDVQLLKTTARHSWLSVILKKGKLSELRKAIKDAGFEILAFERYRIGGFTADELSEGSWKRLTEDEINLLTSSAELVESEVSEISDDKKPKWQQLYQQWFKST